MATLPAPSEISALFQKALEYYLKGNFAEAEAYCLKINSSIPDQPDTLHLFALIYVQTKRYSLANDYFTQAIARAPDRADFLGNYANTLWKQGNIDEAINYCNKSLTINPDQAEIYNILGNAYLVQNRVEAAVKIFQKALQYRPNYPHGLNNLGNALQKINRLEEAVSCYKKALQLQENYPEAYNNLGQTFKALGRVEEARNSFQKAIALRPDYIQAIANYQEVDPIWVDPLDGKKIFLRRYSEMDAEYLHQCYQNNRFMDQYNQFISRYQRVEDLASKLREVGKKHPCQVKSIDWIIVKEDTQRPIGLANLVGIEFNHRRAEFLIGLPSSDYHTKGLGLEASLLVLDFAFNKVKLNKLISIVYEDNLAAQRNALELGFVQESFLRDHIIDSANGNFLSFFGNGMTVNDFRGSQRIAKLSNRLLGKDITHAS